VTEADATEADPVAVAVPVAAPEETVASLVVMTVADAVLTEIVLLDTGALVLFVLAAVDGILRVTLPLAHSC